MTPAAIPRRWSAFCPFLCFIPSARAKQLRGDGGSLAPNRGTRLFLCRETQMERSSLSRTRIEGHISIVQLHDAVCHGKSDAGAGFPRREIKIEDLFTNLGRNAATLIADVDIDDAIVASPRNHQVPAVRHGLYGVVGNV